ncbi:ATP-dependent RNA helicase rok1 [Penicillium macrosclerotiorum]|uniref:ATP-dependent RNA helicase rok1 n=1 Tax=Penicillium macrosclerotiorum TaxID=303699 RepID=UPI002546D519|nr:ATP-dependent RNA helicase rok1 [Penicillium macrosclerotiorum]KAJ5682910.1 ATP-dependent RNA helicase rok1 [Penicillium macrosclerotiorum]
MDAFRLLTRSTKFKSAAGPAAESAARLPSAGKAANPQLFRTVAGEKLESQKSSKKRKRVPCSEDKEGEDVADLDFFHSTKRSATAKEEASADAKDHQGQRPDLDDEEDEEDSMDEVERRTILNSHKIKVTDMRDLDQIQPQPEPAKASKKKEKKQKKDKTPVLSKKEQKRARRLYPQPLTSFKELRSKYKISRRLAENVADQGFTVPTEVQLGTLPLLLGDHTASTEDSASEPDLLVVAPTGSGKTLSFLIPVINKIVRHHHSQTDEHGILAVVVAPTKELASQIVNEGRKLVAGTGVKITLMKKGMRVVDRDGQGDADVLNEDSDVSSASDEEEDDSKPKKAQKNTPLTKSDILVTTPLQLVNALSLNQTASMANLPLVRSLVLDEADVLLDPLFREQTLDIWRSCVHPELRVSLWSATMGSNVEDLTRSTIKERLEDLGLPSATLHPLVRLVVGLKDSAIPNIDHRLVYAATEQGKLLGLRQLLRPTAATASDVRLRPPFLIFTQTIPRAIALHSELKYDIPAEAGGSSRIAVLHSDLSDIQRSDIMRDFRKGEIWILVTTDLLARGVDFRGINGVVNYDIPNSAAVYVHRVGRTGRAGREGGIAVTYYTKEDIPYVKSIANIIDVSEKLRGTEGEKSIQKWLLDSLPDLSKKDKKELKKHGVKARQVSKQVGKDQGDGKGTRGMRISTKSGFERRLENRKKGAINASRNRKANAAAAEGNESDAGSWEGMED